MRASFLDFLEVLINKININIFFLVLGHFCCTVCLGQSQIHSSSRFIYE